MEWGIQDDIEKDLTVFELAVDKMMPGKKVIAVCANDAGRLSDDLKQRLMKSHGFFMTDHDLMALHQA